MDQFLTIGQSEFSLESFGEFEDSFILQPEAFSDDSSVPVDGDTQYQRSAVVGCVIA
jgi:hypothetical protein